MKNKYDRIIIAIIAAGFLFWCFALSGCYTDKKATKAVTKAILLKPVIAAGLTRTAFPCITVKADTIVNNYDTTIMADCPPVPLQIADYFTIHDTAFFNNVIIKKVQVPVRVTLPEKVVTIRIKDSTDILILSAAYNDVKAQNEKYNKLSYSIGHLFTFWQIWVLLIVTGLWIFRKPLLNRF